MSTSAFLPSTGGRFESLCHNGNDGPTLIEQEAPGLLYLVLGSALGVMGQLLAPVILLRDHVGQLSVAQDKLF